MINAGYCQMMARYNAWQNRSLYDASDRLGDDERRLDRGAFWHSIHQTLCHVLVADSFWMAILDDWKRPNCTLAESGDWIGDWGRLKDARRGADKKISAWADRLDERVLSGMTTWHRGDLPTWQAAVHLFNHQTHHRGQVHAMLTAAGMRPDNTDLPLMAEEQEE